MTTDALHRHQSPLLGRRRMAACAGRALVLAIQREPGAQIVIVVPVLPGAGVVTLCAIRAQGLLVFVILDMAGHAGHLGVLEAGRCMTSFALDRRVLAKKRKPCQAMIKLGKFPFAVTVTLLTLHTFLPLMLVIFPVTVQAIHRCSSETAQILVAGNALDTRFRVRVAQDKFGTVMVEATICGLPLGLGMAFSALLAQRRVVLVVLLVASQAILRRLFEHGALVTFLAFDPCVLAQQRKDGGGVVKPG